MKSLARQVPPGMRLGGAALPFRLQRRTVALVAVNLAADPASIGLKVEWKPSLAYLMTAPVLMTLPQK